jgi:hypothetical protein
VVNARNRGGLWVLTVFVLSVVQQCKFVLLKNSDLICKSSEIFFERVTELYCYVATTTSRFDESKEIIEYFFKLHFLNFENDLAECLNHLRRWSEKDREEFLCDLKKNGPFFYRIPRKFNDHNDKSLSDLSDSKDPAKPEEKKQEMSKVLLNIVGPADLWSFIL